MIVPAHPKEDVNTSRIDKEKKVMKKEKNRNNLSIFLTSNNVRNETIACPAHHHLSQNLPVGSHHVSCVPCALTVTRVTSNEITKDLVAQG